jgi:hypothetical protein
MASRRRRTREVPPLVFGVVIVAAVAIGLVVVAMALRTSFAQPSAAPGPSFSPAPPLLDSAPKLQPWPSVPAAKVPPLGYDVSHPQCRKTLPADGGFAIVGVTGGHPFSSNQCVGEQLAWAFKKHGHAVYVNSGFPGTGDPVAYGTAIANDAVAREHAQTGRGTTVWWLDVETANTWAGTTQQNATVLDAIASRLQQLGARVGVYSTPAMWAEIAGDWSPGLPIWYATGPGTAQTAAQACSNSFAGSPAAVVQWVQKTALGVFDHNMVCPAYQNRAGELLDLR